MSTSDEESQTPISEELTPSQDVTNSYNTEEELNPFFQAVNIEEESVSSTPSQATKSRKSRKSRKSSNPRGWSSYFDETSPEQYTFVGYYKHRLEQSDFKNSYQSESYKLKMNLESLMSHGTSEKKAAAAKLEKNRRGIRRIDSELNDLWKQIEPKTENQNKSTRKRKVDNDEFANTIEGDYLVIMFQKKDNSTTLKTILLNYANESSSTYEIARSYIMDLSPSSKIKDEFSDEQWKELIEKPSVCQIPYHDEIKPIIEHLFGEKGITLEKARTKWYTLRNIPTPEYQDDDSYLKKDWNKILRWVERVIGQFLDAFESPKNPLQRCDEREWTGDYISPLIVGALKMDGNCRVPWGEITVLASQRRRNEDKEALTEHLERGHQVDILCQYETHEIFCALVSGGPQKNDLTKISSDNYNLPRIMKDMLDNIHSHFNDINKDGKNLFVIAVQIIMSEIRIYLIEKREVYFLRFLKCIQLPLDFSSYNRLEVALNCAWDIRSMVNVIINELTLEPDDGYETPTGSIMKTETTPEKKPKLCELFLECAVS
ncbi:hypothetical protein C1645_740257 [Glomus cerebriforme]|uniref:Uncharacterized protein n=1 Tax=Glomus cerebriforme TaxID=658196 RepID=A0A397SM40_9GLOM|nr:hypothetical protein C1645_740257 [Glomus cerebriforme]